MSLDALSAEVSRAIASAERELSARAAARAWASVARIEQQIADLAPPGSVSGEVARVGAVTALEKAFDLRGAIELARRYASEAGLSPAMRTRLAAEAERLEKEAASASVDPVVRPIRVHIREAA